MLERNSAVILFPGQGAAVTGSRRIVEQHCAHLYTAAQRLLGTDPFERAEDSTRYAQPATFLASLAGWRACAQAGVQAYAFAGHSLGEIAALTAAGVFAAEDALELVILRARLMNEATASADGGMLAILKGTAEQAERLALQHELHVANYNAPGQTVLSGARPSLDAAAREARAEGLRALNLSVSGAFHSPALRAARDPFQRAVESVSHGHPSAPVLSSMIAAPFTDPPRQLAEALTEPVRWSETMRALDELGAEAYLDVGPDRVLERLAARNLREPSLLDREALGVIA